MRVKRVNAHSMIARSARASMVFVLCRRARDRSRVRVACPTERQAPSSSLGLEAASLLRRSSVQAVPTEVPDR